jgi:hypothetical protein
MLIAAAPAAALAPCARRARALPIAARPDPRAASRLSTAPRAARRQAVAAAGADLAAAKVIVQGRGLEVTPALKEHAQTKVQKARRWIDCSGLAALPQGCRRPRIGLGLRARLCARSRPPPALESDKP